MPAGSLLRRLIYYHLAREVVPINGYSITWLIRASIKRAIALSEAPDSSEPPALRCSETPASTRDVAAIFQLTFYNHVVLKIKNTH